MSSLLSFSLACRRHPLIEFHPWTLPCFRFAFRCCCCCYWSDHYRYLLNVSSFPQLDLKEQKQNVPISLICQKSLLSWNACVKFEENLRKVDERVKFLTFKCSYYVKIRHKLGLLKLTRFFHLCYCEQFMEINWKCWQMMYIFFLNRRWIIRGKSGAGTIQLHHWACVVTDLLNGLHYNSNCPPP